MSLRCLTSPRFDACFLTDSHVPPLNPKFRNLASWLGLSYFLGHHFVKLDNITSTSSPHSLIVTKQMVSVQNKDPEGIVKLDPDFAKLIGECREFSSDEAHLNNISPG